MLAILLLFLTLFSCGNIKEIAPIKKQEGPKYKVNSLTPPIIFSEAIAFANIGGEEPFLWILNNKKELFRNGPKSLYLSIRPGVAKYFEGYGLNPNLFKSQEDPNKYLHKTSMIWNENGESLAIDYSYKEDEYKMLEVFLHHNLIDCQYRREDGFSCRKSVENENPPGEWHVIWDNKDNPIVEMSVHNYYGIYAISKTGKLVAIKNDGPKGIAYAFIHKDLTFRKNSQGRYFINSPSNYLCMQTVDNVIYCSERNALEYGSGQYGLVNDQYPLLAPITTLDFFVKEVAFGGRHFCFLSEEGDVYCQGDNGCGQVTARHDGEQYIKNLTKVDFLNDKVKNITAYASGNCALLLNGDVQCWGLGASVIREKLWDDDAYSKSYSWHLGYRPWQVCLGGAENGI